MDDIRDHMTSAVCQASLAEVREKAREDGGEVCAFSFRSVERPLTMGERREKVLFLQDTFDRLAQENPGKTDAELAALLLEAHGGDGGSHTSLRAFVEDTHPRMASSIMRRRRDPRVMPNILRMLAVRERELGATQEEGDRIVGELQNAIFNECLVNNPTTRAPAQ